jgi:hypothetical protein
VYLHGVATELGRVTTCVVFNGVSFVREGTFGSGICADAFETQARQASTGSQKRLTNVPSVCGHVERLPLQAALSRKSQATRNVTPVNERGIGNQTVSYSLSLARNGKTHIYRTTASNMAARSMITEIGGDY